MLITESNRTELVCINGSWVRRRKMAAKYLKNGYGVPTAKELEVLEMVADGFDNDQIAEMLGIATPTVRTHIEHLRDKLRARDKAALMVRGFRLGLLQLRSRQ